MADLTEGAEVSDLSKSGSPEPEEPGASGILCGNGDQVFGNHLVSHLRKSAIRIREFQLNCVVIWTQNPCFEPKLCSTGSELR